MSIPRRLIKTVRARVELDAVKTEEIEVEETVPDSAGVPSEGSGAADDDIPDLGLIDGGDTGIGGSNAAASSGGTLPSSGKKTVIVKKTVSKKIRTVRKTKVTNRNRKKPFKKIRRTAKKTVKTVKNQRARSEPRKGAFSKEMLLFCKNVLYY